VGPLQPLQLRRAGVVTGAGPAIRTGMVRGCRSGDRHRGAQSSLMGKNSSGWAGDPAAERTEDADLGRAREGDDSAFTRLIQPLRRELHAHCYRMLGSTHDADDAVPDTLLRAWRGLARFEGRSSLRSWLYTVATRACLNIVESRVNGRCPSTLVPPVTVPCSTTAH
jgi:RNA polymerase sigma-70 factor (ECF subfamily)